MSPLSNRPIEKQHTRVPAVIVYLLLALASVGCVAGIIFVIAQTR